MIRAWGRFKGVKGFVGCRLRVWVLWFGLVALSVDQAMFLFGL